MPNDVVQMTKTHIQTNKVLHQQLTSQELLQVKPTHKNKLLVWSNLSQKPLLPDFPFKIDIIADRFLA